MRTSSLLIIIVLITIISYIILSKDIDNGICKETVYYKFYNSTNKEFKEFIDKCI